MFGSCAANITETHSNGDVRLNPGPDRGRLEYYYNGAWGAVCDEGWDQTDALVACRQLGYSNVTAHQLGPESFPDLESLTDWFVSELHCNGSESRIDSCTQNPINENECSDGFWPFSTGSTRIHLACDLYSRVVTSGK